MVRQRILRILQYGCVVITTALCSIGAVAGSAVAGSAADFNGDGLLQRPENWREWVFMGSTVTPDDMNYGAAFSPGMKYAYIDPGSLDHWKKTGTFRTGTVIVQERLESINDEFMNAQGYFPGDYSGLLAMVKDVERFPETVWGFFSFGSPPYVDSARNVPGMGDLDCAGCHAAGADHDWVFTRFYPTLTSVAGSLKSEGQVLYERDWTPVTADANSMGDGLGPLFNARSCNACHPDGGRGKFAFLKDGAIKGESLLLKIGTDDDGDGAYGGQVQPLAIPGFAGEGVPAVQFEQVLDASGAKLQKPVFELRNASYGNIDSGSTLSGRVSQAIMGLGALDRVSDETILALTDPEDRNQDGISGRVNAIALPMGGTIIGRFGWKAGQASLTIQTAKAFRMDMGMSSHVMGPAWGDCTPIQQDCHEALTGERPEKGNREVSKDVVAAITDHVASLAAPHPAYGDPGGQQVFNQVGCVACHTTSLPYDDGKQIAAYTDLLLHDMGPGLADGLEEGSSTGSEWRTAPLMGLGVLLKQQARLLHDGRARDVNEAILWHEGEASGVVDAYRNLGDGERTKLHQFLAEL